MVHKTWKQRPPIVLGAPKLRQAGNQCDWTLVEPDTMFNLCKSYVIRLCKGYVKGAYGSYRGLI